MRPSASLLTMRLTCLEATRCRHFAHDVVRAPTGVVALGDALVDDLTQRRARPDVRGIDPVELGVAVVGDDDARLGVEHRQPLHHVLERRIEEKVLAPELVVRGLELGQRPIERAEREKGEREIGGDRQDESAEADRGNLRQQRAQAGRHLRHADLRTGGEYRRLAGKCRPREQVALLHHHDAVGVEDALHDGGGGGGANLAHRRQLVGVVFPRRIGRIDVLRRPRRAQLGLVGERVGLFEVADDAVADRDRQGRDERDDETQQGHQVANLHRPFRRRPAGDEAKPGAIAAAPKFARAEASSRRCNPVRNG